MNENKWRGWVYQQVALPMTTFRQVLCSAVVAMGHFFSHTEMWVNISPVSAHFLCRDHEQLIGSVLERNLQLKEPSTL